MLLALFNLPLTGTTQNLIPYNKNGLIGLCDLNGKIIVRPAYSWISFYKDRLNGYPTQKGERYGLICKETDHEIPPVSEEPIAATAEYLVAIRNNELVYYTRADFTEVKTASLEATSQEARPQVPPSNNPTLLKFSREKVLQLFTQTYPNNFNPDSINAFGVNSDYFQVTARVNGKPSYIAIFLPQTETFLLNTEDIVYNAATWVPSKKTYFITTASMDQKTSVITSEKQVILPAKNYARLTVMPEYIGFSADNGKRNEFYYLINSGKTIKNRFSDFRFAATISDNGKPFDIFSVSIENTERHRSERVMIGENGKEYFEVDFPFE